MAKTEKRTKKAPKIPKAITLAVQAAEDKKANDLVVLDQVHLTEKGSAVLIDAIIDRILVPGGSGK